MAPRSAWWQSVSEQGSRLVCRLEAIRVLAAARPARDCLFVALSGHELGYLGIEPYIRRRPDLIKRAHAWIFFGSDIGSPRRQNRIQASDDALEQWAVAVMEREGLVVDALPTAGPRRSTWACWPGTSGRLRTEHFSWQTNLLFRDEAETEKHVASSFRFPLPASPRITRPTIVADSSNSCYRKGCGRALARESNPQAGIVAIPSKVPI